MLALLGGLALTVVLVARMEASQQALAQAHFDNEVARATAELRDRMERPLSALLGLRALYAANAQFKRLEFVRYVSASDISNRFPAALGFGFIEPVRRGALDAFLERERADDALTSRCTRPVRPVVAVRHQVHRADDGQPSCLGLEPGL